LVKLVDKLAPVPTTEVLCYATPITTPAPTTTIATTTPTTIPTTTKGPCCTEFFSDEGYKGTTKATKCGDVPDIAKDPQMSVFSGWDGISSVKIPDACVVEVFKNSGHTGESRKLHGNIDALVNLGAWNDAVKSFKISRQDPCCADFYAIPVYGGYTIKKCVNVGNFEVDPQMVSFSKPWLSGSGFDPISALKVEAGCVVEVFPNNDFTGTPAIYRENTSNLGSWSDKVKSFKLYRE